MRTNKDDSDPRTSFWGAVYGNDPWYDIGSDFDSVSKVETVYDKFGGAIGSRVVNDCASAFVIEKKEVQPLSNVSRVSSVKSGRVRMRDCAPPFGLRNVIESVPKVSVDSAPLSCASEVILEEKKSELHPFKLEFGLLGGGRKKKGQKKVNVKKSRPTCGPYIKSTNKSRDIAPPHRFENLTYNDENTTIQAASPFRIVTYQFTSAYDVSGGILTTAYAGFEENVAFYDENRVHKTEVVWDVANNEATVGVRVGMIPTTYDANANVTTFQGAIDLMEGPFSTGLIMLGRANGGECVHKFKYTILPQMVLGDSIYFTDRDYAGTFNSSPTVMLFLNLVVVSVGSGTNLANGVTGNLSLRSLIKFYNRRLIVDPDPLKVKEKYVKPKVKEKDPESDSDEIVVVSSRKKIRDR